MYKFWTGERAFFLLFTIDRGGGRGMLPSPMDPPRVEGQTFPSDGASHAARHGRNQSTVSRRLVSHAGNHRQTQT